MDSFGRQSQGDLDCLAPGARRRFEERRAHILFKPEAVWSRVVMRALHSLARRGFEYQTAALVSLRRVHIELLWPRQIVDASREWLDWLDILYEGRTGLYVALRDDSAGGGSAIERLAGVKHALREECVGTEPLAGLFNFVHCSDGLTEQVRELAVLLGSRERRAFLARSTAADSDRSLATLLGRLYAREPAHDLSVARAAARVRASSDGALRRLRAGDRGAWWELRSRHRSAAETVDLVVLGAACLRREAAGATRRGATQRNGADHYLKHGATWLAAQPDTSWLERLTFCVFKPESHVTATGKAILDRIVTAGFRAVGWRSLVFDRTVMRTLWAHRLVSVSALRLDTIDYLGTFPPVVLVMLEDMAPGSRSASARLNAIKGAGDPEQRRPGDLRWELPLQSRLLSFVHCPDGPDAVVRELAVLFDEVGRSRLIDEALESRDCTVAVREVLDETSRMYGPRDLSWESSTRRLLGRAPRARAALSALQAGDRSRWWEFLSYVEEADDLVDPWDIVVVGANVA